MPGDKDYSAELGYANGFLSYKAQGVSWELKISSIRLVGEYTTANGPYIDDYFFVFLTALEGGWHEASFYAQGRDEVLRSLSVALGAPIETGLCNSAHYKTRIIWPSKWKDQERMEVLPRKTNGLLARLFDSGDRDIMPSKAMHEVFRDEQATQTEGPGTPGASPVRG